MWVVRLHIVFGWGMGVGKGIVGGLGVGYLWSSFTAGWSLELD